MPIYEFECLSCGKRFELYVQGCRINTICPVCKSNDVRKVPSVSSFRIKGYSEANGYSKKDT